MSKNFILLFTILGIAHTSFAKAYHAGKREMILKAECIAVVTITSVEDSAKKGLHWTYRQKATAKVEKVLKGHAPPNIDIYGMETFICAQCRYSKGKFILFLRKDEEIWVGSNWGLGIRPITQGKVHWFKDNGHRFEAKEIKLDSVIDEIAQTVEEQHRFSSNPIWSGISVDGTTLTMRDATESKDEDYIELANANIFSRLRSLNLSGKIPDTVTCPHLRVHVLS